MDSIVLIAPLIIAVAFFCEAVFGFGGGLIAIPLLSLFMGVRDAVTLTLIFQFLMGLLIFRSYKQISWTLSTPLTAGIIGGTLIGTYLLSQVSEIWLQVLLACGIVLFVTRSVLYGGQYSMTASTMFSSLWGAAGGAVQGVIGTGGPILTMFLASQNLDKATLRATLIYLLFVTSVIRVCLSVPLGLITPNLLDIALIALLPFLIAIYAGHYMHRHTNDTVYRYGLYALLLLSALLLLQKAFVSYYEAERVPYSSSTFRFVNAESE